MELVHRLDNTREHLLAHFEFFPYACLLDNKLYNTFRIKDFPKIYEEMFKILLDRLNLEKNKFDREVKIR